MKTIENPKKAVMHFEEVAKNYHEAANQHKAITNDKAHQSMFIAHEHSTHGAEAEFSKGWDCFDLD